ncbi:MAG: ABC transporter ATP-binding protein [Lachnospiraceae bacterium]|nr:ABC transporter ATP-binding protein [Lachnospiraceae bacterium]
MKRKKEQGLLHTYKNNFYLIKICLQAAPSVVFAVIFEAVRNEIVTFLEFTFGLNYVLEAVEYQKPFSEVLLFLVGLFIFVFIGLLFNATLYHRIMTKGTPKIKYKFKSMLYEKAKTVELEYYDNPEYYNEYITAISEADQQIDRVINMLSQLFGSITMLALVGGFYISQNFVSLIFVVVSFVLSFAINSKLNKMNYDIKMQKYTQVKKRNYISRIFYLADYAKEIRLHPEVSGQFEEEFEEANKEIKAIDKKYGKKKMLLSILNNFGCNEFIINGIYIVYLIYCAAVLGTISYGDVVVLFNSANRLKNQLRIAAQLQPYAMETSMYVDRIQKFLNLEAKIVSTQNREVSDTPQEIKFEHVSFKYDKKEILSDLNLNIQPKTKIAIVGYNGAGKTTLVKLLTRLYDPTSGEIKLGDHSIKEYNLERYREQIGVAFQDFCVYAASVRDNIVMDKSENIDENRLKDAVAQSGLSERVASMKHGLDTQLTQEFDTDGVSLSEGEKQKVAIARVIYADNNIVVMDEPSAALDPIAEYNLNQIISKLADEKTVIFITHRLATTRIADKIIFMENGKIEEAGTHQELLMKDGKYARMWNLQASQYNEISQTVVCGS